VHGSNARKQKSYVFLITAYVFSSTKLEKRVEQVRPGRGGGRKRAGGRREKCPKQYMHILINE
jgi:hypothetical protein